MHHKSRIYPCPCSQTSVKSRATPMHVKTLICATFLRLHRPEWPAEALCYRVVVRPSVRHQTCEHDILKVHEPISTQIETNAPQDKSIKLNFWCQGVKGQGHRRRNRQPGNLLDRRGRQWTCARPSASWDLDLWPPDPQSWIFSSPRPIDHLHQFAEKSVYSFFEISCYRTGNKRTHDGRTARNMPPPTLDW